MATPTMIRTALLLAILTATACTAGDPDAPAPGIDAGLPTCDVCPASALTCDDSGACVCVVEGKPPIPCTR